MSRARSWRQPVRCSPRSASRRCRGPAETLRSWIELVVAAVRAAEDHLRDDDGVRGRLGGRRDDAATASSAETSARRRRFHGGGVLSEESEDGAEPYRRSGRRGDGSVTRRRTRCAGRCASGRRRGHPLARATPGRRGRAGAPCRRGRCARPSGRPAQRGQRRRRRVAVGVVAADLDRGDPRVQPRRAAPAGPDRRCRGGRPSARRPARARAAPSTSLSASAVSSSENAPPPARVTSALSFGLPVGARPVRAAAATAPEAQAAERDRLARRGRVRVRSRGRAASSALHGRRPAGAAVDHEPRHGRRAITAGAAPSWSASACVSTSASSRFTPASLSRSQDRPVRRPGVHEHRVAPSWISVASPWPMSRNDTRARPGAGARRGARRGDAPTPSAIAADRRDRRPPTAAARAAAAPAARAGRGGPAPAPRRRAPRQRRASRRATPTGDERQRRRPRRGIARGRVRDRSR